MVISINIGQYEKNGSHLGIDGVECEDLDEIYFDYEHMKMLCNESNYKLFRNNQNIHGHRRKLQIF